MGDEIEGILHRLDHLDAIDDPADLITLVGRLGRNLHERLLRLEADRSTSAQPSELATGPATVDSRGQDALCKVYEAGARAILAEVRQALALAPDDARTTLQAARELVAEAERLRRRRAFGPDVHMPAIASWPSDAP